MLPSSDRAWPWRPWPSPATWGSPPARRPRRREAIQRGGLAERAQAAVRGQAPSFSLEEFIRNLPGEALAGVDPKQLAEIVRALPGVDTSGMDIEARVATYWRESAPEYRELQYKRAGLAAEGIKASEALIRQAELVLQQLNRASERLEKAAQGLEEAPARPTVQNFSYPNSRWIGADAASKARRTMNGERRSRARGIG